LATAWPIITRCQESRLSRSGSSADRGGIEQEIGAGERHGAGGFWEPLVPADRHADRSKAGGEAAKAGVAGAKEELLLIARPVGDMALAVQPEVAAVGIKDLDRVVVFGAGLLEERDRDDHAELLGQRLKVAQRGVAFGFASALEVLFTLGAAEVVTFEQLGGQDDLCALAGGLADHLGGERNVRGDVIGEIGL
jgi:hypothetical protein